MRSLLIGGLALALVGCASTPAIHLDESKAIDAAWISLHAASDALDVLVRTGVTTKAQDVLIAQNAPKIVQALDAATAANKAGDNATATQNVQAATALLASLTAILTEKGVSL